MKKYFILWLLILFCANIVSAQSRAFRVAAKSGISTSEKPAIGVK